MLNKIIAVGILLLLLIGGIYIITQDSAPPEENIEEDISKILLESVSLGSNYLEAATNEDGSFIYNYDAATDTESSGYNMLRHAGTIYSMMQSYNITGNEEVLTAAENAIEFLLSHMQPYVTASVIVYNDAIKLGGNALAIIALAEYTIVTGEETYLEDMQNLAEYIKFSQYESGKFISKRTASTDEIVDWDSSYYPGEAILSLVRLNSIDKDPEWLDIAEKAAKYLINVRDAGVQTYNMYHDHWLLMGLNELYRQRNDSLYYNQAMRIAEAIMYCQRNGVINQPEHEEWLGSFYTSSAKSPTTPTTTQTATRSEALVAAYQLSKDFGNKDMQDQIFDALSLAISFQLSTQFTQENVKTLPNPQKALGGFHSTLTDYTIQIDFVQHNICAIMGYYKIIKNHL